MTKTLKQRFSEIAVESQVLLPGQVPTKPADPVLPNRNFLGWKNILDNNDFDWTKPIIENTTVYARWEMIPVEYVDKNGDVQTLTKEYTVLTETNYPEYTYIYYGSVWLVAKGEVTRPCLDFSGSVNLILTDGAKLTIDDTDCGMRALEINVYGPHMARRSWPLPQGNRSGCLGLYQAKNSYNTVTPAQSAGVSCTWNKSGMTVGHHHWNNFF